MSRYFAIVIWDQLVLSKTQCSSNMELLVEFHDKKLEGQAVWRTLWDVDKTTSDT